MQRSCPRALAALVLVASALACRTTSRESAPPPASPDVHAEHAEHAATPEPARRGYTAADVHFLTDMIAHHGQALTMAALVPSHTTRAEMRVLAERIEVSQQDEIASMRRWLGRHGEAVPSPDGRQGHHHDAEPGGAEAAPMPGMLTEAELAQLAAASGPAFDRLFLTFMIRHHEGAITMVRQLFAAPGAGQDSELYRFATDVESDQRAEITRMRQLLATVPTSQ